MASSSGSIDHMDCKIRLRDVHIHQTRGDSSSVSDFNTNNIVDVLPLMFRYVSAGNAAAQAVSFYGCIHFAPYLL